MRSKGWPIVGLAVALLVGFFAWEWYLSPRARVTRTLSSAASAAEEVDADGVLSFLTPDYSDYVHPSREALESRLREGFERLDRANVTLSAIDVEVDGDEATARFDLVVVAIRGEERYVVVGTPFQPEKVTATLVRGPEGWRIQAVERSPDP